MQLDSLNQGEYTNMAARSFNLVLIFELEDLAGVSSIEINLEVFVDEAALFRQINDPQYLITNSNPIFNQVQYLQVEQNNAMLAEIKMAQDFYSPNLKALKIREIINNYL
jgi:hypothetical protein